MRAWLLAALAVPAVGAVRVQLHVVHLQPSAGQVNVREVFLLEGDGAGPRALRFFVPRAGQASLRATSQREDGKPMDLTPRRVNREGVYALNLPAPSGQTRIDLSYTARLGDDAAFTGKTFHPGVPVRLVTPSGIALEGEGVEALGQEGQATIYGVQGADFVVHLREAEPGEEGPGLQSILPRAYDHLPWILVPALVVLLAGFLRHYLKGQAGGGRRR